MRRAPIPRVLVQRAKRDMNLDVLCGFDTKARCIVVWGARPGADQSQTRDRPVSTKKGGQSAMLVRIRTIPPDLPPCFRIASGMAPTSRIVGSERGPSSHSSQATQGKRRPFHFKRLTPIDRPVWPVTLVLEGSI